jgi:hypothetical protein
LPGPLRTVAPSLDCVAQQQVHALHFAGATGEAELHGAVAAAAHGPNMGIEHAVIEIRPGCGSNAGDAAFAVAIVVLLALVAILIVFFMAVVFFALAVLLIPAVLFVLAVLFFFVMFRVFAAFLALAVLFAFTVIFPLAGELDDLASGLAPVRARTAFDFRAFAITFVFGIGVEQDRDLRDRQGSSTSLIFPTTGFLGWEAVMSKPNSGASIRGLPTGAPALLICPCIPLESTIFNGLSEQNRKRLLPSTNPAGSQLVHLPSHGA